MTFNKEQERKIGDTFKFISEAKESAEAFTASAGDAKANLITYLVETSEKATKKGVTKMVNKTFKDFIELAKDSGDTSSVDAYNLASSLIDGDKEEQQ